MGIRVHSFTRATLVALCALAAGSCSKSPTQQGPTPGGISITPGFLSFGTVSATHQMTASVTDQAGNPITNPSVSWSSMFPDVATIGSGGLVTVAGGGIDTIVATAGSVKGKAVIVVSQAAAGMSKQGGDAQSWATSSTLPLTLQVRVVDSASFPVVGAPVTFAVQTGGGSIVEHAAITDLSGFARVHWTLGASVGAQSVTASLAPATPLTFTATAAAPGTAAHLTLFSGDGQTGLDTFPVNFPPSVMVKDAGGLPVSGVSVSFAVTSGGGSVTGGSTTTNAQGIATVGSWKIQDGVNTLRATSGAVTADTVVFSATGQTAQFPIDIQYVVPVSPTRHAAVDSAAARWSRVIYGALSSVPVTAPAGSCFSKKTPAINQTIDGVLIFVELDSIDGPFNILGQAGPCFIRSNSRLPLVGIIQLDTADLALIESHGDLNNVVLHEMGHVLGYGTLWDPLDLNLLANAKEDGGVDPHFIGGQSVAAFAGMGGTNYTGGAPVPVEDSGGPGTVDGHWREKVFHTELMTGYLNSGVANPLSVVTIASLGDEGYTVNYAAADVYSQAFSFRTGGAGTTLHLVNDRIHGPIYMLSPTGHIMGVIRR
ncbi:MAG TPA: leishmanolysin-related zinc metalloendopeptidase [Gemmatimonadales bacterium]|nr:leishmanolysin-related zinc metalloendopeptidase [Gemmatimonadales bacterium]